MTKRHTALVDSCVLLDIFNDDDHWYAWSSNILFEMSKDHNLVINTIIFTEIAFNFDTYEQLEETLRQLDIQTLTIPLEAAFNVSRINKFASRALHLSPRQDRGVLRRRKPKTARYADFKNTKTIMFPVARPRGIASSKSTEKTMAAGKHPCQTFTSAPMQAIWMHR